MKKAVLILLLIGCGLIVNAQSKTKITGKEAPATTASMADDEDEQPKLPPDLDMLRFFYIRYMAPYVDGSQPSDLSRKQGQLRRKFCTPGCLDQYLKLAQESENDPFIKAPEVDVAAIRSLQLAKKSNQPGRYTITYEAGDKVTIELSLVNEKGEWKIDHIY